MTKKLLCLQIDAFTRKLYAGNPCAVVLDADDLSEAVMQAIALEMNLSETAFVMASKVADLRARYFTPSEEIPLAGHPTIAATYALIASGRLQAQEKPFTIRLELQAGVIEVEIKTDLGWAVLDHHVAATAKVLTHLLTRSCFARVWVKSR